MTTILVIDDELDISGAIEAILEEEGYAVVSLGDGRTCLEMVERHQPDLVLLDVMLPFINGLELLKRLDESPHRATPVVLMSAVPLQETPKSCSNYRGFLRKPFSLDQLLDIVQSEVGSPA